MPGVCVVLSKVISSSPLVTRLNCLTLFGLGEVSTRFCSLKYFAEAFGVKSAAILI
jgi:hypothetical protein